MGSWKVLRTWINSQYTVNCLAIIPVIHCCQCSYVGYVVKVTKKMFLKRVNLFSKQPTEAWHYQVTLQPTIQKSSQI